jgi:hypothetical protein
MHFRALPPQIVPATRQSLKALSRYPVRFSDRFSVAVGLEPAQEPGADHVVARGHGRPCVAPRRTDAVGRPKALERPAKLLPFPAALSQDHPAGLGTLQNSWFANLLPLY